MVAIFYRAVTQTVLLFGSETWFLSSSMDRTVEGTHTGFLIKIMGKRERQKADRTWYTPATEEVREAVGTYPDTNYIGRRQGTVSQ